MSTSFRIEIVSTLVTVRIEIVTLVREQGELLHPGLTTAGVADAPGAVAASQPLPVENLKESCHAAQLLFQ